MKETRGQTEADVDGFLKPNTGQPGVPLGGGGGGSGAGGAAGGGGGAGKAGGLCNVKNYQE